MEAMFITVTGCNHYYGLAPFEIGNIVKLVKDQKNEYDGEAIKIVMPYINTVGYVANSTSTTYKGTYSAGRLYDKIGEYAYARIMFVTHSSAIALVLTNEANEICDEIFDEKDSDSITF